jgi:hypothetical protein
LKIRMLGRRISNYTAQQLGSNAMFETIFQQQPALIVPALALVGGTVVFTVWILAHYWKRARQIDLDSSLKQDMLNRGLSAADIERVLWASSDGAAASVNTAAQEVISDNEYYLVEKMIDEGKSVEEIERLVRAFKGNGLTARRVIEAVQQG